MPLHPALELMGTKSNRLSGKKIVLAITGSIAAVETVKLTHELIRHGATVYPVLTKAACEIISPEALKYASGNVPITRITGEVEHVSLCGCTKDKVDLLLIAPTTANTISKIACGIDDTTVTTFATTAIGSKIPIMMVPAMHSSMYVHSIIKDNIKKLEKKEFNIEILKPIRAEKKHKLPSVEEIVSKVIRKLWINDFVNKRVLVIAGATAEPVDDMRILTNRSSGKTGVALAKLAYLRGADVVLWLGKCAINPPSLIKCDRFETVNELEKMVSNLKKRGPSAFQVILTCAAISDYTTKNTTSGKLHSGKAQLDLKLVPTPKIIKLIRQRVPNSYLVGFKAEAKATQKQLLERAIKRLEEWKLNLIVANDLSKVSLDTNQIYIIHSKNKYKRYKGDKLDLAQKILDEVLLK